MNVIIPLDIVSGLFVVPASPCDDFADLWRFGVFKGVLSLFPCCGENFCFRFPLPSITSAASGAIIVIPVSCGDAVLAPGICSAFLVDLAHCEDYFHSLCVLLAHSGQLECLSAASTGIFCSLQVGCPGVKMFHNRVHTDGHGTHLL